MNSRFIQSPEKRKIIEALKEQFGISSLPFLLIETGREKIRAFSGSLSKEEIMEIGRITNIEIIGAYLLKKEGDYRLSFDAVHILKHQISKNIEEIDEKQFDLWIHGKDIELPSPPSQPGTKIIKFRNDFIGCGKSNGKIIFNYVPKERRLR